MNPFKPGDQVVFDNTISRWNIGKLYTIRQITDDGFVMDRDGVQITMNHQMFWAMKPRLAGEFET